jgi:hypothetical protein
LKPDASEAGVKTRSATLPRISVVPTSDGKTGVFGPPAGLATVHGQPRGHFAAREEDRASPRRS